MRQGILAAVVAGVLALGAEQCQAQGWGYGGPFLYGAGYGLFVYERIPQYSLFPPVYYKHPVPRPYGWSPYAYPPGAPTPQVTPVSRRVITVNTYVAQSDAADAAAAGKPVPLVIHNPFVPTQTAQAKAPSRALADTAEPGG
ncbi:MAG TPA: hypothetical protein VHY20_14220 [Pirellulales bacterium]|nr:hypothetical protein [Pirellulales bacterium]